MPAIYISASPNPSLSWVLYLLLAFLLISIAAGATIGRNIMNGRAPGPLSESNAAEGADKTETNEKKPRE